MGCTKLPHLSKPKKEESWLSYFQFFPVFLFLTRQIFTAVLSKCNLLCPKVDGSSRTRKIWCHLFPCKSSSNQNWGHNSAHSPFTQALWMVHEKETGLEQALYSIHILHFCQVTGKYLQTVHCGQSTSIPYQICLNPCEQLSRGPAQSQKAGPLRKHTRLPPTASHRARTQCKPLSHIKAKHH